MKLKHMVVFATLAVTASFLFLLLLFRDMAQLNKLADFTATIPLARAIPQN
jgi:hypothetical protein